MEEIKISKQTIDIEDVFKKKNPGLARLIPGFIFAYLKKIIHEKEINDILYHNKDSMGLSFVDATIREFGAIVKVRGEENIPEKGRYMIASNHPLGGLDGMALMQVVGRVRKDIVFPVNDILLFLPNLKDLFIPINKHGTNTENLEVIHKTFESEKMILYFPAGLVSRKQHGKIEDLEWKKTFISKAVHYKRDVIPVYINGNNSDFFYNLARIRKVIGIKANIEMLYLPNEMFKQKNKTIEIIIGKAIPWQAFDKHYNYKEWAQQVKKHVYAIGRGIENSFNQETQN